MRRNLGIALLWLAGALCAAHALPPAVQSHWSVLNKEQQDILRAREAQLNVMTPEQLAELRARIAAWHALPFEQRRARREAWQAWQTLPFEERDRLEAIAAAFAARPSEEQRALHAEFDALDASAQRGWLLGPSLGHDYPRLQPLMAQVPAAQRDALLSLLYAMTPAERADLAVLAQRTPPQQRDALRRELLIVPRATLTLWLRQRLDE